MEAHSDRKLTFDPSIGVLIPSPAISHTHAVAPQPFDLSTLLTVKSALAYFSEHAIAHFPLKQRAIQYAGQAVVIREMAKLRRSMVQAWKIESMPEVKLTIHQNPKTRPIEDFKYWRKTLGWAGSRATNMREQKSRYSTLLPGKSRLLKGVYDKYIWDNERGKWVRTSHSGVLEKNERREWVCKELERIDELRYNTMAEWKLKTDDAYMAATKKKRKRAVESSSPPDSALAYTQQDYGTDRANVVTSGFKSPRSAGFDNSTELSIEPVAKRPRPSIESPFDFLLPEIPDSQKTKSPFSEAFFTSPDADHETRSQAPEPESPINQNFSYGTETTDDFLKRYSFILEIPTTDGQRVEWIKFLENYQWNHGMISSLRRFFMAEITPNTTQSKAFLNKLKAVCATIKLVNENPEGERTYRLLWDTKASVYVTENIIDAANPQTPANMQKQPIWTTTPKASPISKKKDRTLKTPSPSNFTISPTESQVHEAAAAENIQFAMKKYVTTLHKGDRVEPPCDRCREFGIECRINKTSCKTCADSHNRCQWTEVEAKELQGIMERSPKPAPRSAGNIESGRKSGMKGAIAVDGSAVERRVLTRGRSVYDFPEDGEETRIFLEDDEEEATVAEGNAEGDDALDSGDDDEDEWTISS